MTHTTGRRPPAAPLASAHLIAGAHSMPCLLAPVAGDPTPTGIEIILGATPKGAPIKIKASIRWLDDLESAIQVARAAAIIQGDMKVPA